MVTTKIPTVRGLFEAHLPVEDIPRAVRFYRDIVGLELAYEVPDRGAAVPLDRRAWRRDAGPVVAGDGADGDAAAHRVRSRARTSSGARRRPLRLPGVTPLSFFGDEADEPSVIGWMPAAAVHFRDPDGHMLEYLAMLEESPRPEAGITTWSDWVSGRG